MNKEGLSPLVATLLLVVFALVIGTVAMSWGRSYTASIVEEPTVEQPIVIEPQDVAVDPLKALQIEYIQGKITKDEYLQRQKDLLEIS